MKDQEVTSVMSLTKNNKSEQEKFYKSVKTFNSNIWLKRHKLTTKLGEIKILYFYHSRIMTLHYPNTSSKVSYIWNIQFKALTSKVLLMVH